MGSYFIIYIDAILKNKEFNSAEVNQGRPFKAGSRWFPIEFHPLMGSFQAKEQIATKGDTIYTGGLQPSSRNQLREHPKGGQMGSPNKNREQSSHLLPK